MAGEQSLATVTHIIVVSNVAVLETLFTYHIHKEAFEFI